MKQSLFFRHQGPTPAPFFVGWVSRSARYCFNTAATSFSTTRTSVLRAPHKYRKNVTLTPSLLPAEPLPRRPTSQVDFIRRDMSSSDIICLQEFWLDPSYDAIFRSALGEDYDFHTVKRTGGKSDGVAVLLRRGKFDVRSKRGLSLSAVGDRVALVMHLRSLVGGEAGGGDGGQAAGEDLILVNTHLAFPHNALDRVNQMSQIEAVTRTVEGVIGEAGLPPMTPRVVVGDLNVEETDPVCRHLGKNGFRSAFASLHRERRVITHRNHRGEEVSTPCGQKRSPIL